VRAAEGGGGHLHASTEVTGVVPWGQVRWAGVAGGSRERREEELSQGCKVVDKGVAVQGWRGGCGRRALRGGAGKSAGKLERHAES